MVSLTVRDRVLSHVEYMAMSEGRILPKQVLEELTDHICTVLESVPKKPI